jgi:regulator of replication initiation timing
MQESSELKFLRDHVNQQKEQLALNEETRVGMTIKLRDANDKRVVSLKEAKKLLQELKFERIACEGAKKKGAVFEFEVVGLREDKVNLIAEQSLHKLRIGELTYALNEERSKRLIEMHENEKLKNRNNILEEKLALAEMSALTANTELLEKIQRLETTTLLNESKARVIYSQSADLNELSDELFRGKAEERGLHKTILSTVDELNSLKLENSHLKAELSRIRKDLVEVSVKQSDKARAFLGSKSRAGTRGVTSSFAGIPTLSNIQFSDESFAVSTMSTGPFNSRPSTSLSSSLSVVTALTSPHRPQRISADSSLSPVPHSFESIDHSDSFPLVESPLSSPVNKVHKVNQSNKPKTVYVSSGLGFRQEPSFSPKGSAKMMLKKIMNDFNNS